MYYLAPSLPTSSRISEDLRDIGIADWLIHVISKDESGLKEQKLNSSNWLETHDLIRDGFIGANLGFISGVLLAGAVMLFKPFGEETPGVVFFFVIVVATLFGAWVGGLIGMNSDNKKIQRFKKPIDEGQYLFLIYSPKGYGEKVKQMMAERHPEATHVATDNKFINPFARVRRKKAALDKT